MAPILGYTRCAGFRCMTAAVAFPATIPLCDEHLARMRQELSTTEPAPVDLRVVDAMVYYMTFDGGTTVKIGTTTSPKKRFKDLVKVHGAFELLVAEPGHLKLERDRHRQFKDLALGNEFFRHEGPLREHVSLLVRSIPDWRRLVDVIHEERGGRRPIVI